VMPQIAWQILIPQSHNKFYVYIKINLSAE
jgi:hypothetical protein